MSAQITPVIAEGTAGGLVRGSAAILTPGQFSELDERCRIYAGRPLRVYRKSERPVFGCINYFASACCINIKLLSEDGIGAWQEIALLEVASEISIERWNNAVRPEIDLCKVPADKIHEFVVWHEIGHLMDNYCPWEAQTKRSREWGEISEVNEVLADRFAWCAMFPGEPFPVRNGREHVDDWLQGWGAKLADFPRALKRPITPLGEAIPVQHLKRKIPWSRGIPGPQIDPLVEARRTYSNYRRRIQCRERRARFSA